MGLIIWVVVIILIGGIVFLSADIEKKDTRKKHLDGLIDLLHAEQHDISGRVNSYELRFEYRKAPFLYEDIEDKVFEKVIYRGFLRLNLPIQFNVVFTEHKKTSFRSIPLFLAQSSSAATSNKIESPKGFKEFDIFSNKPEVATKLFEDDAVARAFAKFKNKDINGRPEMALEIVDGVLVLKFYPLGQQLEPTIFDLRNNVSLIENFLEDMLVIYRQMCKIAEELD